jgi:hypothetical protein
MTHKMFLIMIHSQPGHAQPLPPQSAHLDAFSHVLVEHVFLLNDDNVICQALLDLWGDSCNQE